ncbi:MAG: 23S rRNA (adenine(2030)-N(6))-methyltransferase RlmJ [Magnetococcales bacterium]|nr:23S rRNA (adenine(2030)-N(6))-methyltransferase RlmJ [Magnetococcales bacterium]
MLSYQHEYHAGGPADVHKHASLAVLLARLTVKERPLTYIESHAGDGMYDLESPSALKTGEGQQGIGSIWDRGVLEWDHPYRRVIEQVRERFGVNWYPGSPWLAGALLREQDSIHLMELHPGAHGSLRRVFRADNRVHVHRRDGYEGVLAILPPKPRRSLILIDPAYEVKTEYEQVARFIPRIHHKCPEAVIMVWYPLLRDPLHQGLCSMLSQADLPGFYRRETMVAAPGSSRRLYGSGLVFVNLPHGVLDALDAVDRIVPLHE